jgi:hypothetical protein
MSSCSGIGTTAASASCCHSAAVKICHRCLCSDAASWLLLLLVVLLLLLLLLVLLLMVWLLRR